MLTVMVCLDGSGNNRTLSPLANLYSVIPSAEVIFSGIAKETAGAVATTDCFVVALLATGFCWAKSRAAELTQIKPERIIFFIIVD